MFIKHWSLFSLTKNKKSISRLSIYLMKIIEKTTERSKRFLKKPFWPFYRNREEKNWSKSIYPTSEYSSFYWLVSLLLQYTKKTMTIERASVYYTVWFIVVIALPLDNLIGNLLFLFSSTFISIKHRKKEIFDFPINHVAWFLFCLPQGSFSLNEK